MDAEREANFRNWESRVPIHLASRDYGVDSLASGARRLSDVVAFDAPHLGDVTGLDTIHLQCHIGTDTISLARLGARVTGLDFSPAALAAARDLAVRAGVDATFVESELYDAPAALESATFDLVYTGVGALNWLPDIGRWAGVVARLLRPGGHLYLREGHPVFYAVDDDVKLTLPYFERGGAIRWDTDVSYVDGEGRLEHPVSYEWNHGLGEIVQAVLDAGLVVTRLVEHDFCEWQGLPQMVLGADRKWRMPDHGECVPLMYTLEARKPSES
jgi:SAM-dependent methyltransferase